MMDLRAGMRVLVRLVAVAALASAPACEGDDDECEKCCECQFDMSPIVYAPSPSGECGSCSEQCAALSEREFMGQEFDRVDQVECDE